MIIDNQGRLQLKPKHIQVLRAVGALISYREESNENKAVSINAYTIHKNSGIAYKTCKKYLKQLKELK